MVKKIILIVTFFILSAPMISYACSCTGTSTVQEEFNEAAAVVIVRFSSIKGSSALKDEYRSVRGLYAIVEKVYKGQLTVGQKLYFEQGGGADCRHKFYRRDLGGRFLIYAHDGQIKRGVYYGSVCGRDSRLSGAGNDLLYLNKLDKVWGKSRISGRLSYKSSLPDKYGKYGYLNLSGFKITISGNGKTYDLVTDTNGAFEIYDLPPGLYSLKPENNPDFALKSFYRATSYQYFISTDVFVVKDKTPDGDKEKIIDLWDDENDSYWVALAAGKHEELNFVYEPNTRISGKITGPSGEPLYGCVDIVRASNKNRNDFTGSACADENGQYLLENLAPGKYHVVLNREGRVSGEVPYERFYFPLVRNRRQAQAVTLREGKLMPDIDFRLPSLADTVQISGRIEFADGVGAEGVFAVLKLAGKPGIDGGAVNAQTNENGEFVLTALKGWRGEIFTSVFLFKGKYENCPEIDEYINRNGKYSGISYKSNVIPVSPESDISGVVFKLPFKSCKRAK